MNSDQAETRAARKQEAHPGTAEALAELLRAASERGQPVVPWGAGTLQHLGCAPPPAALTLHTSALNGILGYVPADLTVTVEAGIAIGALQEALGQHKQWLPWDPPAPAEATIGGLLAAGVNGPPRLGYGSPRDRVLGMRIALGDGRLVKSGGKVVKNVAGYEAHKLHIGALGTLGVIVEATFKLAPLPEAIGSLLIACRSRERACVLADRLRDRPLAPISLALLINAGSLAAGIVAGHTDDTLLIVRFAGAPAAVARQLRDAKALAVDDGVAFELNGSQDQAIWRGIAGFAAASEGAGEAGILLRAGVRPADLPALLTALDHHTPGSQLVAYPGVGLAYARWPITDNAGTLATLRAQLGSMGGYAIVENAPAELRSRLDIWGPPPTTLPLMQAIKAQWDPRGILNPGRYCV